VVVADNASQAAQLLAALRATPGITSVTPPVIRAGHAWLQGTLTSAPDSQASFRTIALARTAVHAVPGAEAMVGGNTAVTLDIPTAADHDRDATLGSSGKTWITSRGNPGSAWGVTVRATGSYPPRRVGGEWLCSTCPSGP
jgi:hypothetical protein